MHGHKREAYFTNYMQVVPRMTENLHLQLFHIHLDAQCIRGEGGDKTREVIDG